MSDRGDAPKDSKRDKIVDAMYASGSNRKGVREVRSEEVGRNASPVTDREKNDGR